MLYITKILISTIKLNKFLFISIAYCVYIISSIYYNNGVFIKREGVG